MQLYEDIELPTPLTPPDCTRPECDNNNSNNLLSSTGSASSSDSKKSTAHKVINLGDIGIICVDDLSPVFLRDLMSGASQRQLDGIESALHSMTGILRLCRLVLLVMPQPLICGAGVEDDKISPKLKEYRDELRRVILRSARLWCAVGGRRRKIW